MNQATREQLEARGYWIGDAEDFLDLCPYERSILQLRLALSTAVREARGKNGLTQAKLATLMKSTQGRVAKIETGSSEVSVELMIRALYAAGGDLASAGIAIEPRLARTPPTSGPAPWPKPEEEKIPAKSAAPGSAKPKRSRKPIEA